MSDPTDTELVGKARTGDLDAFGELMRRHHARMAGICANLLYDRAEADDAVQEVFIKAYRSLGNFHGDAEFSTWLFRIAMNHCIDVKKSAGWRKTVSLDALVEWRGEALGGDAREPASREHAQEAELAQKLLAELPIDYRQALVLRIDGMDYEEIARTLRCSVEAVRARLRRARRLLSENMRRSAPPEDVGGAGRHGDRL